MLLLERILNKIKKHTVGLELTKFRNYKNHFVNKVGLEIGGPSGIFADGQILPIYAITDRVDGVNFSTQTVWENTIQAGQTYNYSLNKLGYQYILEASDLSVIPEEQYDFLLSSHSLEHCANPLKALKEWQRVIRKGGAIMVALPDRRVTFDHRRNITKFDHLLDDYTKNIEEDDCTHIDEILRLHDVSRDPGVENKEQFSIRSLNNYENRCLHHHVFDVALLQQMFAYIGMKVIYTDSFLPSIIVLAVKED